MNDFAFDNDKNSEASPSSARRDGGVTFRVVVLCLLLAFAFGYIIPIIDVKLTNTFLGGAHLPPGALGVLLILLLVVNPLLKLAGERWAFSRNEILTVYITCLFSCLVPGHGAENFLVSNVLGPFYYASPENKWLEFLLPHMKPWLTPVLAETGKLNAEVAAGWYVGNGGKIPWNAWLVPLMAWSSVVVASYVMLGCFSVMLRAQWAEREALAFPLLRLPLELTENADQKGVNPFTGLFSNRLMWIGFSVAVFIQLLNGLNQYFPDVPQIPLTLQGKYFSETPWNQIGSPPPFRVLPIVTGITYLLTSEVSFSLWFFYWFMRLQLIGAYYLGFVPAALPTFIGSTWGTKTFTGYQHVGAYIGYALITLWTAREHLKHIARRAFGRARAGENEKREMMSYPAAFWGFVISFLFIIGWSYVAGISLLVAFVMWTSYLVISICLTRVVVEGGLLFVQQGWVPLGMFSQIAGSGSGTWLTPSSLVPASFVQGALMTDLRAFLMPSFLQSFKLAHDRGLRRKPLLFLIAAVILITLVMGLWMNVRLGYDNGGLQLNSWFQDGGAKKPATDAQKLISGVSNATWFNTFWIGVGIAMTWGMTLARSRFLWFPLHPIGLLMSLTYPMNVIWFSIFIGWLCKVLVTKFGGSDAYRKSTPIFLGLALGDVVMMLFWLAVDGWFGKTLHQLMPG